MPIEKEKLLAEVAEYYSDKFARFGETPNGVDWNGAESQSLRFEQLCKVIDQEGAFSVNDLGCGYGAMFEFLRSNFRDFSYRGSDITDDTIRAARVRHRASSNASFETANAPSDKADYGIASGVFNVRQQRTDSEWLAYLKDMLDILDATSIKGFAFNCLTSYSDEDKKRAYLYYADPCALFDYCKTRFSRHVALLHDYGLYEFTILIRKQQ
jgi:SAM-dependent methyltransferase